MSWEPPEGRGVIASTAKGPAEMPPHRKMTLEDRKRAAAKAIVHRYNPSGFTIRETVLLTKDEVHGLTHDPILALRVKHDIHIRLLEHLPLPFSGWEMFDADPPGVRHMDGQSVASFYLQPHTPYEVWQEARRWLETSS